MHRDAILTTIVYPEMYRDTIFTIEIYPNMYHDTVSLAVSSVFLRSVFLRLHARFLCVCLVIRTHVSLPMVHLKVH